MKVKYNVAPAGGNAGDVRDVSDSHGETLLRAGLATEVTRAPRATKSEDTNQEDE